MRGFSYEGGIPGSARSTGATDRIKRFFVGTEELVALSLFASTHLSTVSPRNFSAASEGGS